MKVGIWAGGDGGGEDVQCEMSHVEFIFSTFIKEGENIIQKF